MLQIDFPHGGIIDAEDFFEEDLLHNGGEVVGDEQRHVAKVGKRQELPNFTGQSIGDDVSWVGDSVFRCVVLQMAGAGTDKYVWGRCWAKALKDLGATVGILCETRLTGPQAHAMAVNGLLDGGFVALSHNVEQENPETQADAYGPKSAGVIIAVVREMPGGWHQVQKDLDGRGLAGTLYLKDEVQLRVVGTYRVSGACLPGFHTRPAASRIEAALNEYIEMQAAEADRQGWVLLVAGDMNSFANTRLDTWGGNYMVREDCLARKLEALQMTDTFRALHPERRAFRFPRQDDGKQARPNLDETAVGCRSDRPQRSHCVAMGRASRPRPGSRGHPV